MEYSALESAYPTLYDKNVPVPPPQVNGGWWHKESAAPAGEVPKVDPTWSGQADNLIASGAMPETSHHYPSGGVRPGNNEPEFLKRFVATEGGNRLSVPYYQHTFDAAPFDTNPFGFSI
jgi:hypothetical protein